MTHWGGDQFAVCPLGEGEGKRDTGGVGGGPDAVMLGNHGHCFNSITSNGRQDGGNSASCNSFRPAGCFSLCRQWL